MRVTYRKSAFSFCFIVLNHALTHLDTKPNTLASSRYDDSLELLLETNEEWKWNNLHGYFSSVVVAMTLVKIWQPCQP